LSRELLRSTIAPLPYRLRDDVLSYASFVEEVAPLRAADIDVTLSRDEHDQVVFLAGVLYVRDLIAGQLALAEAATGQGNYAASADVRGLLIGGEELKRGSPYIRRLRRLRQRLNRLLAEAGVPPTASRLTDAIHLVAAAGEH
jgi:hypothetical protein